MMLFATALNLTAKNFTIKGRFTDVSNDTLLISYTMREPDEKDIDVRCPSMRKDVSNTVATSDMLISRVLRCSRTAISRACSLCRMKASRWEVRRFQTITGRLAAVSFIKDGTA